MELSMVCGRRLKFIRLPKERFRCECFSRAMLEFSRFILKEELVNLPLEGGRFTWLIGKWEDHFPGVVQSCLPQPMSVHAPTLLDCGCLRCAILFHFENMWLRELILCPKWDFIGKVPNKGALVSNLSRKLRMSKEDIHDLEPEVMLHELMTNCRVQVCV